MENLRLKTKKDMIPSIKEGQSWAEWFQEQKGNKQIVCGSIGYAGSKIHRMVAEYININGENVIISLSSLCGSQSYKSGLGINLNYSQEHITCKKCNS